MKIVSSKILAARTIRSNHYFFVSLFFPRVVGFKHTPRIFYKSSQSWGKMKWSSHFNTKKTSEDKSHFYIQSVRRSWHRNVGTEQVAAVMVITQQRMKRVDDRRMPGTAAAFFILFFIFLHNHAAGKEFIRRTPR